jgi:hypothetical protein
MTQQRVKAKIGDFAKNIQKHIRTPHGDNSTTKFNLHDIKDQEFSHDIVYEGCQFVVDQRSQIVYENCLFKGIMVFKSCEISVGIKFVNCEFRDGISFIDTNVSDYIWLEGCTLSGETILYNCSLDQLNFRNCTMQDMYVSGSIKGSSIRNFPINFFKTNIGKIKIEKSTLEMPLQLHNTNVKSFSATATIFMSDVSFGGFEGETFDAEDLLIVSSEFHQRVDFYNGEVKQQLLLQKVNF